MCAKEEALQWITDSDARCAIMDTEMEEMGKVQADADQRSQVLDDSISVLKDEREDVIRQEDDGLAQLEASRNERRALTLKLDAADATLGSRGQQSDFLGQELANQQACVAKNEAAIDIACDKLNEFEAVRVTRVDELVALGKQISDRQVEEKAEQKRLDDEERQRRLGVPSSAAQNQGSTQAADGKQQAERTSP